MCTKKNLKYKNIIYSKNPFVIPVIKIVHSEFLGTEVNLHSISRGKSHMFGFPCGGQGSC